MDELERHLRDVLTSERRTLDPALVSLDRIHAGATRRHRRRVAMTAGGTVVAVLAAAGIGFAIGGDEGNQSVGPISSSTPTQKSSASPEPSQSSTDATGTTGPAWDDARVMSMTATSTRTIVVLGRTNGPCEATCLRLAESHDGGATFSSLPLPNSANAVDDAEGPRADTAQEVRFGSADDGWLSGGGLWSSHDGGHTWQAVNLPGQDFLPGGTNGVYRLEAAAGYTWALVDTGGDKDQLWRAKVGSDDWRPVEGVDVDEPGDLAVQGNRVTVVGANGSPAWSNASGDFQQVENPCTSAVQVELSTSAGVWAKCTTGTAAYLAASPDGVAWTKIDFDTGGGMPPNSMAVGARTPSEALVWLGNGETALSHLGTDGTLTPVASPPGTGISWMGFTTKDLGYAITCCSIQTLLRTDDGGDTWTDAGPH